MTSGILVLTCVLLNFPGMAVGLGGASSTQHIPSGVERSTKELPQTQESRLSSVQQSIRERRCETGLGPVVAQQGTDLASVRVTLKAMEYQLQTTRTELQKTKAEQQTMRTELQKTKAQLQTTETELQRIKTDLEGKLTAINGSITPIDQESTFVRWGRKTCPSNTKLVYSGIAGGKQYNEKGSGTNPLCLTRKPEFDDTVVSRTHHANIYGAGYELGNHGDHDVPCSVCGVPQSTTIMVPGTHTCPQGWTAQYTGHMASQHQHYYATEFVCLDAHPEDESSVAIDDNGYLFYYATAQCGSLPCPPYVGGKVVRCVVCSK